MLRRTGLQIPLASLLRRAILHSCFEPDFIFHREESGELYVAARKITRDEFVAQGLCIGNLLFGNAADLGKRMLGAELGGNVCV